MKKRLFSLIVCLSLVICMMPITAHAATIVSEVEIMIPYPAHTEHPGYFLQVYGTGCKWDTSVNTDGYRDGVRWKKISTGQVLTDSDSFVGGELYELSVCLVANSGYAFSVTQSHITVNMEEASFTLTDTSKLRINIQLSAVNLYINTVNIKGLDAPNAGNTPDYSATVEQNSCQTAVDVFWYDVTDGEYMSASDTFEGGHEYWAEVQVKSKPGFEFPDNVYADINGKSASINHNTGTSVSFTVNFPTLDSHVHTPSAWRTNQVYHYKACTTCGEMLDHDDHSGGVATCKDPGTCIVCGYAYIEANENHTPDTKWTACGNLYHAHLCKVCGAHCDPEEHVPGPEATDDTPQKCTVCSYVLVPAKNHVHNLTKQPKAPATCTEPGSVEHYACDGCDEKFADSEGKEKISFAELTIAPLGHTASDDWEYDENYHWRICTECEEVLEETKMVHETEDGECTTCGYDGKPITKDESKENQSKDTSDDEKIEKKTDFGWIWIIVVAIVCLAIGITIPLVFAKIKNKKE